jgi:hypothetical protein
MVAVVSLFGMPLSSEFLYTYRMLNVVALETGGDNFVVNFSGTYFQAQEALMNLSRKSGPLCHFWTSNMLENAVCSANEN